MSENKEEIVAAANQEEEAKEAQVQDLEEQNDVTGGAICVE